VSQDVQLARFGRQLQAQFGLRAMHILTSLVGDVLPTVNLDSPPPEFSLFQGVDLAIGQASLTSAAAEFPTVSLASHPQRIIVVEGVQIATQAASVPVQVSFQESIAGAAGVSSYRDTRRQRQGVPGARVVSLSDPILPGTAFLLTRSLNNQLYLPLNVVLTQRTGTVVPSLLTVAGTTANSQLTATFYWRERLAQPDELAAL